MRRGEATASPGIAAAPMSTIATLYPGKAFALQNAIELDGRIGHYPVSARGFAPCNCYLLCEDDAALLLDTGFGIHRDIIIAQIESLIGRDTPLSFMTLRVNDFMSVCNAVPIARHFSIERYIALFQNALFALDFDSRTAADAAATTALIPVQLTTGNEWIELGKSGNRPVRINQSPIRLINTRWLYDPLSKTLFSSDMFAHSWSDRPEASWFIDADNDDITTDDVRRFLLSTRYWWLEGAKTDELRQKLGEVFDEFDIENIAPGYGKILRGKDVVARHYRMLDDVLRDLDQSRTPPRYIAHNEEHYS